MCVNIIYVCICLYNVICLILYYRSLLICTNKEFMNSVEIDLNFNVTKSCCVAFTPKLYKLALPSLHINHLPISCTDSIKYLGYILTSDNSVDAEMLTQMRLLYCRSNRVIWMFNKCSRNVLTELRRSVCTIFYCPHFFTQYKKNLSVYKMYQMYAILTYFKSNYVMSECILFNRDYVYS